jgi:1-acyl-sn-glycerol-3-phosphate acyltransferase
VSIEAQVERVAALAREEAAHRAAVLNADPRPQRKCLKWRICTGLAALYFHVLFGMRVRRIYTGEPAQHYLFASNHLSYADPPAVSSRLFREVHFVAKDSLFRVPLLGPLIRWVNAFPIKRERFDREAMGHALNLLNTGRSVLIFPEGSRVFGGKLGRPRIGASYLALQSGVPVVPVYIEGSGHLKQCLLRRTPLRVTHGRPVRVPAQLAAEALAHDERAAYRRHADIIMAAIQAIKDTRG